MSDQSPKGAYAAPVLKPGERIRLDPDGPVYTVVRVSACAAYVTRGDWVDANGNVLAGIEGSDAISPCAFVYHEEK